MVSVPLKDGVTRMFDANVDILSLRWVDYLPGRMCGCCVWVPDFCCFEICKPAELDEEKGQSGKTALGGGRYRCRISVESDLCNL